MPGGVILIAFALLAAYAYFPTERVATITFRLTFDGAEDSKFPNGSPFNSADIISNPVLSEVYRANQLGRFSDFQHFKESLLILPANFDQTLIDREYQARLGDTRLNPADRDRIQEEYRKKREAVKSADFQLSLRRTERTRNMPADLTGRVLSDVLTVWAQQAVERRGALKYQIPVLSRNVLTRDLIDNEDYIVAADILRMKIGQILANIDQISNLPGAPLFRTSKEHLSLAEIRVNLMDLLQFRLEPLIGLLRQTGTTQNAQKSSLYFEDRLFQIKLDRERILQRVKTVQDGLRDYVAAKGGGAPEGGYSGGSPNRSTLGSEGTVIPQIGETFLNKLVELSNQSSDVKFRQAFTDRAVTEGLTLADFAKETAYYETLSAAIKSSKSQQRDAALVGDTKKALDELLNSVWRALDAINEIYIEVSAKNLNPQSQLFLLTSSLAVTTIPSLQASRALLYAGLALFLLFFLIPLACLLHGYFTQQIVEAGKTVEQALPAVRSASVSTAAEISASDDDRAAGRKMAAATNAP